MIPKDLKIGDIFEEQGKYGIIRNKIVGFDGQGNYLSEQIREEQIVPVEEITKEELPFAIPDDELVEEEQPVVEEAKEEKAPKKATTRKRTTTKRTSKK